MASKAVYPGTFDPITHGHTHLIERATKVFDRVVVAVAENPGKQTRFPLQERIALAQSVLVSYSNVEVIGFDNLLVDFVRGLEANIIVRGLRAVSDFEYEFQLASMNRQLDGSIETVFLTATEEYAYISSRLVKEIASMKGDVSQFVHPLVLDALGK